MRALFARTQRVRRWLLPHGTDTPGRGQRRLGRGAVPQGGLSRCPALSGPGAPRGAGRVRREFRRGRSLSLACLARADEEVRRRGADDEQRRVRRLVWPTPTPLKNRQARSRSTIVGTASVCGASKNRVAPSSKRSFIAPTARFNRVAGVCCSTAPPIPNTSINGPANYVRSSGPKIKIWCQSSCSASRTNGLPGRRGGGGGGGGGAGAGGGRARGAAEGGAGGGAAASGNAAARG